MADGNSDQGGSILREAIAIVVDDKLRNCRTIVPGKVAAVARTTLGEVDVDFDAGIGKRVGGEECGDGQVPSAGVYQLGGGGFSMRFPLAEGDEVLAVCADRNTERWRQTKIVGQAHSLSERHHDLSDAGVLPMRLTPPTPSAPATVTNETTDWVLQSAKGDVIRVSPDGPLTLRKGPDGATLATIEMLASGSILIAVPTGQTIKAGDELAEALVKVSRLEAAMTAMLTAGGAVAPTPMAGTNGALAFQAAKIAWDSTIAGAPLDTVKLLGS